MVPLPIDQSMPQIIAQLREHRAMVLVAEPGAGKTTRVPPAILAAGDLLSPKNPNLVMLQPRRVAARAAAERIADERGWMLGNEVGYHVRFDRKLTRDTRLRVVTEGILTRQLLDDPFLEGVGAVVLDEFHERSIHTDLTIALLREVRQSVRSDLMLIVMSATLEAEPVAKFLGDAPIVRVPGRTFPVEITHEQKLGVHVTDQIVSTLQNLDDPGDVLIFLPGAPEIRRVMRDLSPLAASQNWLVLPLHASLPSDEQTRALRPAPAGQRKIICATNIAETSLTIDGVRVVIDSGLARIAGYDARRGLDRLELKRISKASAIQRAGRAGRTAAGRCIRLWSAKEFHESPDFELPEIQRVDLAGTVLALHAWGHADPRKFPWYQPPPEATIAAAEKLLAMLGALDSPAKGRITELGRKMLSLPAHPRIARLLVAAAEMGLLQEGAAIAAILSEKDFVPDDTPAARGNSDLLARMQWLDRPEARSVARLRDELLRIAKRVEPKRAKPPSGQIGDALLKLALLAYPDRVARRRNADTATMVGGGGVRLGRQSVVHDWEFFVAADARHDERNPAQQATVRMASGIRSEWLEELFPPAIRRERDVVFDAERQRVVGVNRVTYHDLVLRETQDAQVDPTRAAQVLADVVAPMASEIINANEAASELIARVSFLRQHMPEQAWPALDGREIVAEACAGNR
ncbi:MAG: ATP-dependent helicase HrpB, partial [Anaerolineae bacterium]|nr:ATP-dependent helicase HrpB [Phycisphaerae bacterium]